MRHPRGVTIRQTSGLFSFGAPIACPAAADSDAAEIFAGGAAFAAAIDLEDLKALESRPTMTSRDSFELANRLRPFSARLATRSTALWGGVLAPRRPGP